MDSAAIDRIALFPECPSVGPVARVSSSSLLFSGRRMANMIGSFACAIHIARGTQSYRRALWFFLSSEQTCDVLVVFVDAL